MKALQISTTAIQLESDLERKMTLRSERNLEIRMGRHLEPTSIALMAVRLGLNLYLSADLLAVTSVALLDQMLALPSAVALVSQLDLMMADQLA
jgi:hypothetical protein